MSLHLSKCLLLEIMSRLIYSPYQISYSLKKSIMISQNLSTAAVIIGFVCLFVCFVALRPKSTAMVIAGRSVNLTTLFPGQA